ncbi:GFA family protein [Sphingorhabdus sp. Alg231-15]|uniref:GFA family protein n=1 Tax=Sphingorhabdus sp. Alg231-15 TaxID=1922222 RepID=UPI000D55524D
MSEMKGQCHCGAVQITVPAPPEETLQCNCSLCRKTGWRGGYWNPDVVTIDAQPEMLNSYVQGDKMITLWNCKHCGSHTHWTPRTAPPDRMAVNMRIFDPVDWQHLPVREVDGASL